MERAETIPKGSRTQGGPKREGRECKECGEVRKIQGHGLCSKCYHRKWRKTENRGKWNSKDFPDGCTKCGRTDKKHQGRGLCPGCYSLQYKEENTERIQQLAKEGYYRNREKRLKYNRDRYQNDPEVRKKANRRAFLQKYDGNGIPALERDHYTCTSCGFNEYPEVMEIHHIDRDRSNNDIDNLQTVCPTCHRLIHIRS